MGRCAISPARRPKASACSARWSGSARPAGASSGDPFAERFLGPAARATLAAFRMTGRLARRAQEQAPGVSTFVVSRHRFIDDALTRALDSGAEQLVLLGAGYDSRAYRFAEKLAGRTVFELDFPSTSQAKRRIVEEHADELPDPALKRVPIDFLRERIDERLPSPARSRGAATARSTPRVSFTAARVRYIETPSHTKKLRAPTSNPADRAAPSDARPPTRRLRPLLARGRPGVASPLRWPGRCRCSCPPRTRGCRGRRIGRAGVR